jgi:hypothetical protein
MAKAINYGVIYGLSSFGLAARTGSTKTSITNATDPDGVRLELLDFLPDSLPRKAMDSWSEPRP